VTMTEEIVGEPTPDATRFCEECARWTPHWMEDNGSYSCNLCEERDQS